MNEKANKMIKKKIYKRKSTALSVTKKNAIYKLFACICKTLDRRKI